MNSFLTDEVSEVPMKRESTKSTLQFLLVVCCIPAIGCDVAKIALNGSLDGVAASATADSSDDAIREMFAQANAACPTRMDKYTTLESVTMIDDQRIEFHYKVNNEGKNLARRFDKQALKKAAVNHVKGNRMAVAIAQRDLSIEHIYEDAFGSHILSYTINKQSLAGNLNPLGREQENPFEVTTVNSSPQQRVTKDSPPRNSPPVAPQEPGNSRTPEASAKLHAAASAEEAKSAKSDPSEPLAPEPEVEPELPQIFKPIRSNENPAGVRSNPFFD